MTDKKSRLSALPIETKKRIIDLCCQLSPENLSRDGEISRSRTEQRRNALMKEWKKLERDICMRFSEMDVPTSMWDECLGSPMDYSY